MPWIKRNLYFVITVIVGLGLTGYCAYLLLSALDQNKADSEKYNSDKSSLDLLQKKNPFPDAKNIEAAELDAERVRTFLEEFHKPFAGFPTPPTLDDRQFHEYLQNSIIEFTKEATNAGVGLPPNASFAFSQQINVLNYPSNCITPWIQELTEIKAILHILYKAKINYLQGIERPAVPGEDIAGADYLQVTSVTNSIGVVTPYMVNFRGFSTELANVMAGIAASSNCLILKTLHVEPSRDPLPQIIDLQPTVQAPPVQYYRPPPQAFPDNPFTQGPRSFRGGERRNGGFPPPQQYYAPPIAASAPTLPIGPTTILTENPLFVTIYIDVVKLKEPEARPVPAAAPASSRRPSRRAER